MALSAGDCGVAHDSRSPVRHASAMRWIVFDTITSPLRTAHRGISACYTSPPHGAPHIVVSGTAPRPLPSRDRGGRLRRPTAHCGGLGMSTRRRKPLPLALSVLATLTVVAAVGWAKQPGKKSPDGTLKLEVRDLGAGLVGWTWGHGALTYKGTQH